MSRRLLGTLFVCGLALTGPSAASAEDCTLPVCAAVGAMPDGPSNCKGIVNVCPGVTSCTGTVNVCFGAGQCNGGVNVCDVDPIQKQAG